MEKIDADRPIVKSLQGGKVSYTLFENRSTCVASIYWHNFEGQKIKYADIEPNGTHSMKTYEEHPWSAQDPTTGKILPIDKNPVFYPRHNPTTHERVYIDNPTDVTNITDKGLGDAMGARKCDGHAEVRWSTPKYDGPFAEVRWFDMTFEYCDVFKYNAI